MTSPLDRRIAGLVIRARERPWRAIRGWLLLLAVAWIAAFAAGGESFDQLSVPDSGSARAERLAEGSLVGGVLGIDAVAVFHVDHGRIDELKRADAIQVALIDLSQRRYMGIPDRPIIDDQVSADGTTAFAQIRSGYGPPMDEATYRRIARWDRDMAPLGIDVSVGGLLADTVADPAPRILEFIGIAVALVVLARALGSWRSAAWPIVSAGVGVAAALGAVSALSAYIVVPGYASQLAGLIGMGVGIDAGLLLTARWSRSPDGPWDLETSVRAGRSVLLAATTVVVSLAGLLVTGISFFAVMGIATAIAVALVAMASLTLLPALVALDRRGLRRDAWVSQPSPREERLLRRIVRRPLVAASAGVGLILLLAAPAIQMRLATVDAGSAPREDSRRVAHDLLAEKFGPGYPDPFTVVLDHIDGLPWERGPTTDRAVERVTELDGVERVLPTIWGSEGVEAAFRVIPTSGTDAPARRTLLAKMRATVDDVVKGTGSRGAVGGPAATRIDVAERVEQRLPWVIIVVVGLSLLLLIAAWRAPVLALKAAVLNCLSVAAAYGVLVAVFQWGWGATLIGLSDPVPVDPIVPVFLFAILFGLSMDYEVFLVDAVREQRDAGLDVDDAVVTGISATWRVVGIAALVMAAVFAGFIFDADPVSKMFGVGLAAAVAIDATLARGLLVPATLALLGDWNWWTPRRRAAATSEPRPETAPSA